MDRRARLARIIREVRTLHPMSDPWQMADRVIERFTATCPGLRHTDEDEIFAIATEIDDGREPSDPKPN